MKINKDDPVKNGMYVVYTGDQYIRGYPDRKLLMFINKRWGYPNSDQMFYGKVHGWIGPLPAPKISDLERISVKYAIAFRPDGEHGAFIDGPFDSLYEALEVIGEKGHYIYELHLDQESVPIRKWSDKKMKWLKRKKDD